MNLRSIICLALTAIALAGAAAAQEAGVSIAPSNQAFSEYLDNSDAFGKESPVGQISSGIVPEPIDLSHMRGLRSRINTLLALPTYYDLRLQNKLTPIKNQGGCGSCWAFASFGSLESSLMPTYTTDLSENNLKNLHGFDISCCGGGNRTMATAYLARWGGPVAETSDPYNTGSCYSPTGLPVVASVQTVVYVPDRLNVMDNNTIKQAIMTYGALYTSYYHSDAYFNYNTKSYYYYGGSYANHAVCIVGWDDAYPATNFSVPPPGPGAFIARNSWGTYWGQSGYFYVSYYDTQFGAENAAFIADPSLAYDTVYQYDPYGWVSSCGYGGNTAWFANIFTAVSDSTLQAASWYAASPNSNYALYVYWNPTTSPTAGTLAATKSGILAEAGYQTIRLDTPVSLTAGQRFSVVVRLSTPEYNYPIPLERPYGGYCSGATAAPGQSYISGSGASWLDSSQAFSNSNVCLKAFTSESSNPTPGVLTVSPTADFSSTGQVGGPFSPANKIYTLSNAGGIALAWSASKSASWLTLSPESGSLNPGESAYVTVALNSEANALTVGSYSDTINFMNTTDGSGDTTRAVQLMINPNASAYSVQPATFSWIVPDLHIRISLSDNACYKATLPFVFQFYGQNYTTIYIGSNGLLSFSKSSATAYNNTVLPKTTTPNAGIYPYWDDLNPRYGGAIRVGTEGVAPNRMYVVSWVGLPHRMSKTTPFTFQAILCEGTNDIVFQYLNMSSANLVYGAGAKATVGIENKTGTIGIQYSKDTYGTIPDGSALIFGLGL